MFDIKMRVTGTEFLSKLSKDIKGFPRFLSDYAFNHMGSTLSHFDVSVVNNIIYGTSGVKRRTGALGKAFYSYLVRVNQYSFAALAGFNDSVPYVSTHVGDGVQRIFPKGAKKLWIPRAGGPADVYPRKPVRNFYNKYVNAKPNGLKGVYNMVGSVEIMRRIDPRDIESSFNSTIRSAMPSITARALSNWKRTNGY